MKNLKSYFMLIAIMLFGFFVCSNDMVSADTSNFSYVGITVTSDGSYPFENAFKDENNVIKSTNVGEDETQSSLTLTFVGKGEVSFDYLVSSEQGWDVLSISVNGEEVITDSGNEGTWKRFAWYSEENKTNSIVVQYSKDINDSIGDDCCYLKNLSFDATLYAPLLNFAIDGETYNSDATIYYAYGSNNGVLSFADATDYTVSVKLNGVEVTGINFSYDLKNNENYKMNNDIEISYGLDSYKSRSFNLIYNASLSTVSNGLDFFNDSKNMYVVEEYDEELAIKSTNTKDGSYSELYLDVSGSGVFSFSYLVSGRENFDYFRVYIAGSKVMEESGLMDGFRSVSFTFYEVKNYRIIFSYYSNNGAYSMGDDCFYLKDVNFDAVDYSSISEIKLNGQTVVEGSKFVMEQNVAYSVTVGEVEVGVNVLVSLNGNNVELNTETNSYALTDLSEANRIEVAFSEDETITRSILFYLYEEVLTEDTYFVNDDQNPFVRDIYDGEEVIKSTIEGKSNTAAVMKFTAEYNGVLSLSYMALTEVNDLLIIKLNDAVVLKVSKSRVWKNFKINLKKDDIVSFSYEKDNYNNDEVDAVYFSSLVFEEKFYAEIVNGTIGGVDFNNGLEVINFDWENKNPIIVFEDLLENQSIVVKINNNVVSPNAEGRYDLTDFLGYTNEVVIIYSEDGYDDYGVTFKYNAHLITDENISYHSSLGYVLSEIENENVISLNPEYTKLEGENLSLQFFGKGYFAMTFKYFTHTNLTISICMDSFECVNVNPNDYSIGEWHTLKNTFFDDEYHFVTITVNGEYYYSDVDYLYMKDFSFTSEESLLDLVSGEGTEVSPFDYDALLEKIGEIGIDYFEYKTINSSNLTKIFVKGLQNYTYTLNEEIVQFNEIIELDINERGKSTLVISNGAITFNVYYYNQGIADTSISNGYGTLDKPYEIYTVDQFKSINGLGDYYYYVLKNNLELSGEWTGIGTYDVPFTGYFDGGNFKISGLVISSGQYNGLFGVVSDATIKNLTIENAVINKGLIVGTLAGYVNNAEITNINIINTYISLEYVEGEELLLVAGGIVGQAQNSAFHEIVVNGSVKISSIYQNAAGGLSGVGGNFYNSSVSVDVEGTGFVGGAIGYANYAVVEGVEIFGSAKLSNSYIEESSLGIIASDADLHARNVTHKLNGTYTTSNNVVAARLFGLGLVKEGIEVVLSNGTFSVDVMFNTNEEEELHGNYASVSGYIILFVMEDGNYKYYEVFDTKANAIISKDFAINLDELKSYSNDLENLTVNDSSSLYSKVEVDGVEISSYLTVTVDDVLTFEHLALIINYGIPTTLGTYNTYGVYNLTINFVLGANLDFTSSSFRGLASNKALPYKGSIDGNNKEITMGINNSNARLGAFINYASSDATTVIKNLTLRGSITAKYYAGFVGEFANDNGAIEFNNINNYMTVDANKSASLLASSGRSKVTFANCINYADFESSALFSGLGAEVYYSGINKNYGSATDNESKANVYEVFFGTGNVAAFDENSKLENYYVLNVGRKDVSLVIDGKEYTSGDDGLIIFIMNNDNLYTSIISGTLLTEKEYALNSTFVGEIIVPKNVEFDPTNSVIEVDSSSEWILKGIVTFYDDSTEEISLRANLEDESLLSNELVFVDAELIHETYKTSEIVTLKRTTLLLDEYKTCFDELVNANEEFADKANTVKAKYNVLSSIYISGNVSDETLEYYNNYLEVNNIEEENLNAWLDVIIRDIRLKDSSSTVVYGDEATMDVVIHYLNGTSEEKTIEFDYAMEDIVARNVTITSKNAYVVNKGETVVYNEYITFTVPLTNKTLTATVGQHEFEYDGTKKELEFNIEFNNKFGDTISNLNIVYMDSEGSVVEPINAGVYKVGASFDITNSEYYNLGEIHVKDLIINSKEVEVIWEGEISGAYTGEERINEISAYYIENNEKVFVGFNLDSIKNAGEHVVMTVFENENYKATEETASKTFTITKADLTISIADYEVSYKESLPNIIISSSGVLGDDRIQVIYDIVKDDVHYELSANLECGLYDLLIVLDNDRELEENYNITLNNGTLRIVGIDTEITADETVTYIYKGTDFDGKYANVKVKDSKGNEISTPKIKYSYTKNNVAVDSAISVGTYSVKIEFESTKVYNGCEKTITLIIEKAVATIRIDNKISMYGDELVPLTYEVTSGTVHSLISLNLQLTKEEGLSVGKYAITATYNNDNYDITFVDGEYEITQRELHIKIDDKETDYLEKLKLLTYTTFGTVVAGDDLNIVLTKEEGLDAGTYLITGTYNNDQYIVSFEDGIYTINKLDIEDVTFEDVTVTYDGSNVEFGVSSKTLSDGNEADTTYYVGEDIIQNIVNAGTYEVKAVMSNRNYNDLVLEAVIEVKKAENTLGYGVVSEEYEYSSSGVDYKLDNIAFADGRNATVTYIVLKDKAVVDSIVSLGEYIVLAQIDDDLNNYISVVSSKTITVIQKRLVVEYGATTLVYNANKQYPEVTSSESYEMSFNTEDGEAPINVGKYTMTIKPINDNYRIINSIVNFEIVQLEITFDNFEDREQTYCGCSFKNDITSNNIDVFDDVTIVYEYYLENEKVEDMVNVGMYTIKIVNLVGEDASNYKLSADTEMVLTIVPKEIEVTPVSTSKLFGADDPILGYLLSEDLFDGDSVNGALSRETGENVGNYVINLGSLNAAPNYVLTLSDSSVYFYIEKRPVEISYNSDEEFYYDGNEKKLNVDIVGEAHAEYEGDLINVGTYTVKVVIDDNNYCLPEGYEDIKVIINKRDASSSIVVEETEFDYTGEEIVPSVSCGGYECSIKYLRSNEEVEKIVEPGTYIINVLINTKNDSADIDIEIVVKKSKGNSREVTLDIYHNKIIVEQQMDLEYRIDNEEYGATNIFTGLRENTSYRISVRVKENNLMYASDPVIYEVKTTKSPNIIHEDIDKLTNVINEKNLKLIKTIEKNLKEVNEKEINQEKFEFYKTVKEKFELAMESYDENLNVSNKLADFVEFGVMMATVIIPTFAVLYVVKRRFKSL